MPTIIIAHIRNIIRKYSADQKRICMAAMLDMSSDPRYSQASRVTPANEPMMAIKSRRGSARVRGMESAIRQGSSG